MPKTKKKSNLNDLRSMSLDLQRSEIRRKARAQGIKLTRAENTTIDNSENANILGLIKRVRKRNKARDIDVTKFK